jgi:polyisoprenoid-binding protein YceI
MLFSASTILSRKGTARSSRERTLRSWLCLPDWHKQHFPRLRGPIVITVGINRSSIGGKSMTSPHEAAADLSPFAGSWSLDPSHTSIVFHTKALWVLDVRGAFRAIEGSGTVGADDSVSGSIVIDATSVDTKKKKRDDHLRTADFFEVDTHPTITFSLANAHPKGAGTVELSGGLTIRGATRPVTLLAHVSSTDDSATVSTEFDIDRSQWGLTWAKLGAALKNHVVINARFTKS